MSNTGSLDGRKNLLVFNRQSKSKLFAYKNIIFTYRKEEIVVNQVIYKYNNYANLPHSLANDPAYLLSFPRLIRQLPVLPLGTHGCFHVDVT